MNIGHNHRAGRRIREREARRSAILKAGREVFFKSGFSGGTIDDIAKRTGLAKGTIYLYFKSKEEIYLSLMSEGMGMLKDEFIKAAQGVKGDERLLAALGGAYIEFYIKNKRYFTVMFLSGHPDIKNKVSKEFLRASTQNGMQCLSIVADAVASGVKSGAFRKVDPWTAAVILWSSLSGVIFNYEKDPVCREDIYLEGLEHTIKATIDMFINGIKKGKR